MASLAISQNSAFPNFLVEVKGWGKTPGGNTILYVVAPALSQFKQNFLNADSYHIR